MTQHLYQRFSIPIFVFVCALVFPALAFAQKAEQDVFIKGFTVEPFDQSAKEHPLKDGSGNLCALIKVRPESAAFKFSFGYISVKKVESHKENDETWIYVAKNARTITIRRDGFKPLLDQSLGVTCEAGATYILELSYVDPSSQVHKQWLQFEVTPKDEQATVMVKKASAENYEPWGTTDAKGLIARNVECGQYAYQIMAEDYLTSEGVVFLDKPNEKHVEAVTLRPNFGFLQVNDENGIAGAEVYVDNKKVGTIPYTAKNRLSVGTHTIMIMNGELYKPYTTTIDVKQGETATIAPKLESNAAETTLQVESDAEIYLDGKLLGKRQWTGPIKEGKYTVECKLESHKPTVKYITIHANEAQCIQLEAPQPITGFIAVNSSPMDAEIRLDGKVVGTTPMTLSDVLIGRHTLTVSLANHKTEEKTVTVEEGKTADINFTLGNIAKMQINTQPQGAKLYIDGTYAGLTPYTKEMASGDYTLKCTKKKYKTFSQRVHLDSSHPNQTFTLKRQFQQPYSMYIGASFTAPSLMGIGATLGGYIYNINIECSYLFGLSKSETIYWNDGSDAPEQPRTETLSSSFVGGKLGYGITIGTRFRITPQVGIGSVMAAGDCTKSYALVGSAGVRCEFVIVNHLGVSLTPEYRFPLKQSTTFQQVADLSSKVKGWASGFNAALGIYFYF